MFRKSKTAALKAIKEQFEAERNAKKHPKPKEVSHAK